MMRQQYELSQADFESIMAKIDAARNTPLVAIHCGPIRSLQEVANDAWAEVGSRMGFDATTVEPGGGGPRSFTALSSGSPP